jgi:tyrosyl-DNA phosphodiesterase 2
MADYSREQRSMNLKGLNDPSAQSEQPCHLRILSYNLWFREDVAIVARMKAIGDIIHSYGLPDILCFQEVTRLIYSILSRSDWWSNYDVRPAPDDISNLSYFTAILWRKSRLHPNFAAIPFENSIMGRDLKALVFPICGTRFCVATSHLESPTGKNSLYSASRRAQCAKATEVLDSIASNVVFIGDMNWTEANDGEPPLPQGW